MREEKQGSKSASNGFTSLSEGQELIQGVSSNYIVENKSKFSPNPFSDFPDTFDTAYKKFDGK